MDTYKGNDDQILMRGWQDEAKTIPVNLDNFDDIEIRIIVGSGIIGKWNKTGSGDFEALNRIDAYNYWFYFETNDNTKTGKADVWVETKVIDVSLSDNVQNGISVNKEFFNIQEKAY